MKKIVIVLVLSLLFTACGDSDDLAWVNSLDPNKDEERMEEICGDFECGTAIYEGYAVICGACKTDEYCDVAHKCATSCAADACSTQSVQTFTGIQQVECGGCEGESICIQTHLCFTPDEICYRIECGETGYTDENGKQQAIDCGSCPTGEFCNIGQECATEASACEGRCGALHVPTFVGYRDVECGGCEGDFGYCSTDNICETACDTRECGTESVKTDSDGTKVFECGSCSGENAYCHSDYTCETACAGRECGSEVIYTVDGEETMKCGTCLAPSYCDAVFGCKTGTQKDDYIYDENIVVDTATSLMWQRGNQSEKTAADATTFCNDATIDTFHDWRLPTISELRSIVDGCDGVGTGFDTFTGDDATTCGVIDACLDSTCSDANCDGCVNSGGAGVDGLYFTPELWTYTGDTAGRFWSSSTVPNQADSIWFVRFSNASVAYNWIGSEYFVRCVRNME